jgi:hypothetical protein
VEAFLSYACYCLSVLHVCVGDANVPKVKKLNYALYHEDVWGSGWIVMCFLTSALIGGECSASYCDCFTPGERALVPIGQKTAQAPEPIWRTWREYSWPFQDLNLDPSIVQPEASCYPIYVIPAPNCRGERLEEKKINCNKDMLLLHLSFYDKWSKSWTTDKFENRVRSSINYPQIRTNVSSEIFPTISNFSRTFLPLGVASCCTSIQLVLYDAINRSKVSIR